MSAPVGVLAVLAYLASHDWDGDAQPGNAAVDSAIAAVAELIEAAGPLAALLFDPEAADSPLQLEVYPSDVARLQTALARVRGAA